MEALTLPRRSTHYSNFSSSYTSVTPTPTEHIKNTEGDTFVRKYGKIVLCNFVFTVNSPTSTSELYTGLPAAVMAQNVVLAGTIRNSCYRCRIGQNGVLQFWWGGVPDTGGTVNGSFIYMAK